MKTIDPHLTCNASDHFGQRMRAAREHAKLTQQDAAKRIGLSAGQLGKIERGSVTMVSDPSTLVRAGRAYGVSELWLCVGVAAGAKFVPEWYGAPNLTLEAA